MFGQRAFVSLAAMGALLPLLGRHTDPSAAPVSAWPTELAGQGLTPLPPSDLDRDFAQAAPIEVARFACGDAHVVVRRVPLATPRLHSLRECFRGLGRLVRPGSDGLGPCGSPASSFFVEGGPRPMVVHEWIVDADGRVETDFLAWYWRAQSGSLRPPFLAYAYVDR